MLYLLCIAGVGNCSPKVKSSPPPVSVNKVLLEHSHAHWLPSVRSCFHTTVAELSISTETILPRKPQYLLSCPLQNKFADPWYIPFCTLFFSPHFTLLPEQFPYCYKCFINIISNNCLIFYCMVRLWLSLSPVIKYLSCFLPNFFHPYNNKGFSGYIWMYTLSVFSVITLGWGLDYSSGRQEHFMILGTCHQIPSSKMSHGFVLPNNSGEHPHFHMLASTITILNFFCI